LDGRQVRKLIDRHDSPFVRCLGFVYLRFALHSEKLWAWLGDYVIDDEEFQPTGGGGFTTIGDFVESLLIKEKYFTTLLPRISGGVRQQLEKKLAPVSQYRKRMKANREVLDVYEIPGTRVEACIDGVWHDATTIDVEDHPSRPKVCVRLSGGGNETEFIDLGKVIVCDELPARRKQKLMEKRERDARERSRSRSRERDRIDWTRWKGKSDSELVNEIRAAAREQAVCTSGKDYSRRLTTFEKGLALEREGQGVAARRLLEEETFIKTNEKKRSASPDLTAAVRPKVTEPSAEHQERMRKLFEKYGTQSARGASASNDFNSVEGPDKLRLG